MVTLAHLIAAGETLEVEFKREVNDTELVETVVCLANAQGGTLLVGVDDDGCVVGARPRHGRTTDPRRVEALVSNSTRPALGVHAEMESVGGKPVLVVRVPKANIPTATSSGRYLRRALGGDGKPACVPFFVYETAAHGLSQDPSAAVVPGATWADLDALEIERFRRLAREGGGRGDAALLRLSDEELCRALGGIEPGGSGPGIRRVARLLFGHEASLRTLMPTHEVAWQVLRGRAVLDNEIVRLPLLRCFDLVTERFRARNRSTELVDLFRTEIPDFPEESFREALANALTHRDFTRLGAVHVQWTDEGIVIASPGSLPDGVRVDNLLVTPPRPRNPLLADAFKRAGIVERTGRGVDTIFYGQLRFGRPLPRYQVTTDSVTVVLPGSAANLEFVRWLVGEGRAGRHWSLPELLLLRACTEARSLTVDAAAQTIQSDIERARAVLARLVEGGIVEARGEARGRSYHLSAAMYRVLGDRAAYVRVRGFEPPQQEQMVLQYAQEHGQITRGEAAQLCKLSGAQASRLLKRVADAHPELRLEGEKRGARYVWHGPTRIRRKKK
ncbi:MAG: putative DNA binding domain-containing protein [Deltaproteobacteria bacterium]|nr:putative DNA binding domain-containing protein [Deltaproteobacteria bacterium]